MRTVPLGDAGIDVVVLAWLMAGTPSAIPLIAASNEEQLDENLGALRVEPTEGRITTLRTGADGRRPR